ncbi:gamma-aminobutyric acid receptor subunit alpha-5 [Striga asiatica]|uniref:Gamma-aminobutyric acid receptor subunit alpha-5 n=1 Tax=Striga asiatica TaxID=4170 RepID=A0A5A7R791_STRAF|nr:gamma-aminobutyric acid receptor subunit alpha-5 [Striga asiatica]
MEASADANTFGATARVLAVFIKVTTILLALRISQEIALNGLEHHHGLILPHLNLLLINLHTFLPVISARDLANTPTIFFRDNLNTIRNRLKHAAQRIPTNDAIAIPQIITVDSIYTLPHALERAVFPEMNHFDGPHTTVTFQDLDAFDGLGHYFRNEGVRIDYARVEHLCGRDLGDN